MGLRRLIPWEIAVVLGSFDPIDRQALELLRTAAPAANHLRVGITPGESRLSLSLRAELIRSCTMDLRAIGIVGAEHLPCADVLVTLAAPKRWHE